MKLAVVVVGLSVAVMIVMIYQAMHQELQLRNLKARMVENTEEVKRKETAIALVKKKIDDLKATLSAANEKVKTLTDAKTNAEKSTKGFQQSLEACNNEKAEAEKKKTELTATSDKLKGEHEEAKKKAQEQIQGLKQQILDRDRAICAFVDTTKEDARKLCGLSANR